MLPPNESITSTKASLLKALNSRGLTEINGDPIPDDPSDVEFGVPVDKNDLEKGWTRLEVEESVFGKEESSSIRKGAAGKKSNSGAAVSLQAADLRNGQSIAFRFRQRREESGQDESKGEDQEQPDLDNIDLEFEDPGWDVVLPNLDDDMEETI